MKSFKKFVAEVAQPKPEEEKRFKDQHTYEVIKHPVATDAQFTGEINKPKAKRIADQEGEANYDKAVKNPEKRMAAESVNEEVHTVDIDHTGDHDANAKKHNISLAHHKHGAYAVGKKKDLQKYLVKHYDSHEDAKGIHPEVFKESAEQIDEISKKLAGNYIKKAQMDTAHAGDQIATGSMGAQGASPDVKKGYQKQRDKGIAKLIRRRVGTRDAVAKLTGTARVAAKESTDADRARYDAADDRNKKKVTLPKAPWDKKDEELSAKQKKIDHNKNGKIDGQDLAMLRAKKKNESIDETTSSALKRPVTQTGPDGKTRTVMKKARNDKSDDSGQDIMGTNESATFIDEAVKLKRGPMRLKDGSQIMVSKEDADLLNKMFNDLSSTNQRKMQKVMMTDKAGFEEIRGFAREAL